MCKDNFACTEYKAVCCFLCAIQVNVGRRVYHSQFPGTSHIDEGRRQRHGISASSSVNEHCSQPHIGFPFIDTSLDKNVSVDCVEAGIGAVLYLKKPPQLLAWPHQVVDQNLSLLSSIASKRERWFALRNVLVAFCMSQSIPCKWHLDRTRAPIFHHKVVLDKCSWWYNFGKKSCSPLTILLMLGAAIHNRSSPGKEDSEVLSLLGKVHHINQAWYNGRSPETKLANQLYNALYRTTDMDDSKLHQVVGQVKALESVKFLTPNNAKAASSTVEAARDSDNKIRDSDGCQGWRARYWQ